MAGDRNVVIRLRGDIGDFQAKMVAASKSVGAVTDKLTGAEKESAKLRQSWSTVGDTAGRMGAVAAAGVGLVTKAAMDWETAWAGVTKTVDGTTEEMAVLEEGLRELARTLPATHTEIAGVAEAAGQLGVAREDVVSFTKTMIDLSETTNLTAEEAATAIAQMANVMQTAPEDIDNLGAALVALGNDGASTERDIILMSQRISGAAAIIGMAETDVLALANAAASMGIEVEAGGSSISRVLSTMGKAVKDGGEKLAAFADTAGMSSEEFVAAFEERPAAAFEAFTAGLGRINEEGGNVFGTLKTLAMTDVRVSQALLGMASAGDLLTDSLDLGVKAWEENTALAEEAAKRYDTTASQVQVAWNNIKDAAIEFGDVALPVVAQVAEGVAGLAQSIGGLPGPVKAAVTSLGGLTAIFGGGLWFTSKVINGVASMRSGLEGIGVSGDKATRAMKGVGGAAAGFAALGAATAAVRALNDALDENLPATGVLMSNLLDIEERGVSKEFDSIAESIRRMSNPSFTEGFNDWMPNFGFGEAGSLRRAQAEVKALDDAFAEIARSGGVELAMEKFREFAAATDLTVSEQRDLLDAMPVLENAIADAANAAKLAGEDVAGAAPGFEALGTEAGDAAEEVDAVTQALDDLDTKIEGRQGRREAEQAFDDLRERFKERRELIEELADAQADLNEAESPEERESAADRVKDLKDQLKDYKLTLKETEQAGRDWNTELENIAFKTLEAAEEMDGMGRVNFLNRKRREFIELAEVILGSKKEARDLADDLELLHQKPVKPKIDIDLSDAKVKLNGFLNAIPESIAIDIVGKRRGNWSGSGPGFASGGYTGVGGKYEPAGIVHKGEFVFDAQTTAMFRPFFEELHRTRRMPGYADGGYVRQIAAPSYSAPSTVGLSAADIDRLAVAMSQVRPLYGDVNVADGRDFVRTLEQDRHRAALEGRR